MNLIKAFFESGLRPALFTGIALLAAVGFPGGAAADWLVMTDGTRVETAGPWEVRGRMLVFHDASGNLSSVRASNVHLEASQKLTEAMARRREAAAAHQPKEVRRESVLRLTDDDVAHVDPNDVAKDQSDTGDGTPAASYDVLSVSSWDRDFDDESGGVLIRGTLRNAESVPVRSASLYVILRDDDGTMVGRSRARLDRPFLNPSEETGFVARFPGISDFATAEFRADATRPTPPPPDPGSDLEADGLEDDLTDDRSDDGSEAEADPEANPRG